MNQNSAAAYQNLGHALELMGQQQPAAGMYRKALAIEPGYRLSHAYLGRWHLRSGSVDRGRFHLQEALAARDREEPRFTYLVANVFYQAGYREEARTYTERAYELARRWNDQDLARQIRSALALLSQ